MKRALSALCFGCEPLGGRDWGDVDVSAIEAAIRDSVELGVNFFDTAAVYGLGDSERRLSIALGARRHDVVIATKGGLRWSEAPADGRAKVFRDSSKCSIRLGVEDSLRRLRLNRLPIFYVHWPDERIDLAETFGELHELQERQLIAAVGVSNFSVPQIQMASRHCRVDYLQIPVNCLSPTEIDSFSPYCLANGISIVAYNVLARGLLTGKLTESESFPASDRRSRLPQFQRDALSLSLAEVRAVAESARVVGKSLVEYAFSWVLERPAVVSAIAGIKNSQQLRENWLAVQCVARGDDLYG